MELRSESNPAHISTFYVPLSMTLLSDGKTGKNYHVINPSTNAGRHHAQRMTAMGITPGVAIKVVCNNEVGPVLIIVRGTRLAVGRGAARKVSIRNI